MIRRILSLIFSGILILASGFSISSLSTGQTTGIEQNLEFLTPSTGGKFLNWYGDADRSYFLQISEPSDSLKAWFWAPIIEAGNNEDISFEVDGTADKGFFRLHYTDQLPGPSETLETADFDGDGFSNLYEITLRPRPGVTVGFPNLSPNIQTNPLRADTDGDGLGDKWEEENGLDPTDNGTRDPNNGSNGDPDLDGLTNLQEQSAGTNPLSSDTDGDGISDTSEVEQGKNPNDATDAPAADWFVLVGDRPMGEIKAETRKFTIKKGESRIIVIGTQSEEYPEWTGIFSEFDDTLEWSITPSTGTSITGYIHVNDRHLDWEIDEINQISLHGISPAHIESVNTIQAPSTADITVTVILKGTNLSDGTLPSSVIVGLIPLKLTRMWETKNKANQIFNSTKKDDPVATPSPAPDSASSVHGVNTNNLYITEDPSDSKYGISIDATLDEVRRKIIVGAYSGSTKQPGSDKFFLASGPLELRVDSSTDFTIRLGYDSNSNSVLDTTEEVTLSMPASFDGISLGEPTVKIIDPTTYSVMQAAAAIIIASAGTIPHASEFLRLFQNGTTAGMPADKRPTSFEAFDFDAFNGELSEWLTHNSGAVFSDTGIATIPFYHWDSTTTASEMTGLSHTIKTAVQNHFKSTILPEVVTHFASLPFNSAANFPLGGVTEVYHDHESTPAWVTKTTVSFDDPILPNLGGDDAFGVIGRGRIPSHLARYTVKKIQYEEYVGDRLDGSPIFIESTGYEVEARTVGRVEDLYDFNFNAGTINKIGAALQIGYGKGDYGRSSGQIYRWDINWDETFNWVEK